MTSETLFCVQTFHKQGGKLATGEFRQIKSEAEALRVGEMLSGKATGVLVYSIDSDAEFDTWGEPSVIKSWGEAPEPGD